MYKLENTKEEKLKILFEDLEVQNKGDNECILNYKKILFFEMGVSTQWGAKSGSGSIIIKSINLI